MPLMLVWSFLKGVPWQVWAAAAVVMFGWWLYDHGYSTGKADLQQKIDAANVKAEQQATEAKLTVNECYARGEPWVWDREAGTCVKP